MKKPSNIIIVSQVCILEGKFETFSIIWEGKCEVSSSARSKSKRETLKTFFLPRRKLWGWMCSWAAKSESASILVISQSFDEESSLHITKHLNSGDLALLQWRIGRYRLQSPQFRWSPSPSVKDRHWRLKTTSIPVTRSPSMKNRRCRLLTTNVTKSARHWRSQAA